MMGVSVGDLVLFLRGDDSKLAGDLDKAKGKTQSFAGSAVNLLGGVVVGAAAAGAAAVAGIGVAAFDVSKQTQEATANIAAQLGIPIDKAEEFGEVARRVYGNNFAESVQDAGDAVALLAQQLGMTADDPALQTMAENAFRLRDVFGAEVPESIDAVRTLMDNFGLSSEQAFDMLAAGYQRGLDRSGDFLDTIGEYSTQFANGGATATEFFSLLDSGLQGGMLGTDKAADAFKEFRVRIGDGSKTTADALAQIGINVDDLTGKMSDGTLTAADAFTMVQDALANTEDPVARMQAGVGLLGTQYEDLGDSVAGALTLNNEWAAGTEGAINTLDSKYATFGSAVEAVWRRLTTSISPFTDRLLEIVNDAMPKVMGAFDTFDRTVGPVMNGAQTVINNVVNFVKGLFDGFKTSTDTNLTGPLQYWKEWADTNMPLVRTLFDTVIGAITGFWTTFGDDIMAVINNTFGTMWTVIDTAMRTIGDLITLALQILTGDWEGAWETLKGIVDRILGALQTVVSNQLNSLKTVFTAIDWGAAGRGIVDGVRNGINAAWSGLVEWFRNKVAELRNMFPFSEPKDPRSPLRGLGKAGKATVEMYQDGMESALRGLNGALSNGLAGMINAPIGALGGAGSMVNVTVNINGASDPLATGRAAERGVRAALRQAGVRG